MEAISGVFSRLRWILASAILLGSSSSVFAQDEPHPPHMPVALLGGFLIFVLIIAAIGYIYIALALQTIAQKTNTENPWLAWIPIVNLILMVNIAKKPIWWFLLFFVPLVNLVIYVLVWMEIAEARNKPNWWGILIIVPVVNIIVPGYLAWSD